MLTHSTATAGPAAQDLERRSGRSVTADADQRPIHPGGGWCTDVRECRHRHPGTLSPSLDDGHDARQQLGAGSRLPACFHLLLDRDQHLWTTGPSYGSLARFYDWTDRHWIQPLVCAYPIQISQWFNDPLIPFSFVAPGGRINFPTQCVTCIHKATIELHNVIFLLSLSDPFRQNSG